MKTVSRFEASLLRILQGFFGRASTGWIASLVEAEMAPPHCLSRNAIELVKDALKKGVPEYLARQGGWKRDRFLQNGQIAEGRLWNRRPPEQLGLSFSQQSLRFLIWITANHPDHGQYDFPYNESRLTTGDRFLYFLAAQSLRQTDAFRGLMCKPPLKNHPLIWLMNPADLMETKLRPPKAWDFSPWFTEKGASILETLQSSLTESWLKLEQKKSRIQRPESMRRLGTGQHRLLTQLFDAAEGADRRDLGRFFLIAMGRYLQSADREVPLDQMDVQGLRLAERSDAYQAAAVSLRQMERLDRWNREARSTGFYDDGYTAAQLWKANWEKFDGEGILEEAMSRLKAERHRPSLGNPTLE